MYLNYSRNTAVTYISIISLSSKIPYKLLKSRKKVKEEKKDNCDKIIDFLIKIKIINAFHTYIITSAL